MEGYSVIDFHIHAGAPKDWHPWVMEFLDAVNPQAEAQLARVQTQQGLLEFLDEQRVDRAVILAETSPVTTGVVSNDHVRELCKGSDRLIPFASIHPKEAEDAAGELRWLVEMVGFRGLKLYPSSQYFFPDEDFMFPVYETASDLGIPVMFHTGTSIYKQSVQKYSEPLRLDEVAVEFPDLRIVMAHSGRRLWYEQAFFLAERHDNVWMELSGIPPKRVPEVFPNLARVGDRVLFGSDFPGVPSIRANVAAYMELPLEHELVEAILYRNAVSLLGIG